MELVTQEEFKETSNDVRVLKGSMAEVRSDIQTIWAELRKLRDRVDGMAFPSLEEMQTLRARVDKLESALSSLKKVYGDLYQHVWPGCLLLKGSQSGQRKPRVLQASLARLPVTEVESITRSILRVLAASLGS